MIFAKEIVKILGKVKNLITLQGSRHYGKAREP